MLKASRSSAGLLRQSAVHQRMLGISKIVRLRKGIQVAVHGIGEVVVRS